MSIRNTSYYGWNYPFSFNTTTAGVINIIATGVSGTVYVAGNFGLGSSLSGTMFIIKRSNTGVWNLINTNDINSNTFNTSTTAITALAVDPLTGTMYAAVQYSGKTDAKIWKSHVTASNWNLAMDVAGVNAINDIKFSASSPTFFFCGVSGSAVLNNPMFVAKSTDGASTYSLIETCTSSFFNGTPIRLMATASSMFYTSYNRTDGLVVKKYVADNNWSLIDGFANCSSSLSTSSPSLLIGGLIGGGGNYFCCFTSGTINASNFVDFSGNMIVRKSTTGTSGSWSTVLNSGCFNNTLTNIAYDIALNSTDSSLCVCGIENTNQSNFDVANATGSYVMKKSIDGGTTWTTIRAILSGSASVGALNRVLINNNTIISVGSYKNNYFILEGTLAANSASMGTTLLASSFGYALPESAYFDFNPSAFKLNNVSEFPHSSGLFQMKNLVLGTRDAGSIGRDNNAIIQVINIGSTVQIMWPSQVNPTMNVLGYGDVTPGQSIGKLTKAFVPGDFFPVSGSFDQMSLFCYLSKQLSGTLDTIAIRVEKRPLGGVPFTTAEQVMTLVPSGSFATQGQLTDLIYTKQIDYGDLSISQIGWPIDVDLTNVKDVRVSARQVNGQADPNTNLIIYGRFVKRFNGET